MCSYLIILSKHVNIFKERVFNLFNVARAQYRGKRNNMIFDVQKATITKRLVAFVLDVILFAVLAVGFAWLLGLACDYDTHLNCSISTQEAHTTYYKRFYSVDFSQNYNELDDAQKAIWDKYAEQFSNAVSTDNATAIDLDTLLSYQSKYLQSHGVDLFVLDLEFDRYSDEQKRSWRTAYEDCSKELKSIYGEAFFLMKPIKYVQMYEEEFDTDLTKKAEDVAKSQLKNWYKAYEKCDKAFDKDLSYNARMTKIIAFTLMMVSLGILLSMLILEFAVPLFFKNGQTIGKKVFGVAVMHQNGVRVNTITMFIRTFLGKYAVETMVPALLILMIFTGNGAISVIVIALLVIFEIVLFVWKKDTRPFIHDVFAKTVCVDLASQMIFDNELEMMEFKRNAYAESSGDMASDPLYGTSNALASSFVEIDKKSDNTGDTNAQN